MPRAGQEAEAIREVFAVPEVVRHMFAAGGVQAFNPFLAWGPGSASLGAPDFPTDWVTEDGRALLPPGPVYDVVPVWVKMGLRPRPETRVLYHPGSGLLFARIAAEDAERVRGLCSWPLKVQGTEFYYNWSPHSSYQPQVAVSTWLVPASGPGGWGFLPRTPEELMALPETARTLAGRQRITVRSGQRSVVREQRQLPADRENPVAGQQLEAEAVRADDGVTFDVLTRVTLTRELKSSGRVTELKNVSQRLAHHGDCWLVEAGTLPENPPLRVFHLLSLLDKPEVATVHEPLSAMEARWTGKAVAGGADGPDSKAAAAGTAFLVADSYTISTSVESARTRADLARAAAVPAAATEKTENAPTGADPFSASGSQEWRDPWAGAKSVRIPAWFGAEETLDVSALVASAFDLASGTIQAWKWENRVLIKGDPKAVRLIREAQDRFFNPEPAANPVLDAILTLRPDAAPASTAGVPQPTAVSGQPAAKPAPGPGPASGDAVLLRMLLPVLEDHTYDFVMSEKISVPGQAEPDEPTLSKLTLTLAPPADPPSVESEPSTASPKRLADPSPASGGAAAAAVPAAAGSGFSRTFAATVTLSLSPPLVKSPIQVVVNIPAPEDEASEIEIARQPGGGSLVLRLRTHPDTRIPPVAPGRETLLEYWWRRTVENHPAPPVR